MTPTAAPPAPADKKAAPTMNRPFVTGSRFADDFTYDQTKTLTGSTQKLPTFELDTDGFTAGLYLLVENTGAGNASVTASFKEDGPFSVLDTIQFSDTNNKAILGPMNGHDLASCVKYGGYHFVDDPKQSPVFSVTTGTGSTQGSFTFVLYLPIEIVHRDGLGALLNKSASAVFRLDLTLSASTTPFATSAAPATSSSTRVRIAQFGWMDSDTRDIKGNPTAPNPPALNSIQYWDKQTFTFTSGQMAQKLNSFSGGLRTVIFELRDSNLTRSGNEADWPDPFTLQVDKYIPLNRLRTVWRHLIGEDYGYVAAVDTAGGRDSGTYPVSFAKDFGLKPGAENRFGYLWVTSATTFLLKGSVGSGSASHTFNVFLNYVNPAGGDPKALTGGR
jgi:hypothetical protein